MGTGSISVIWLDRYIPIITGQYIRVYVNVLERRKKGEKEEVVEEEEGRREAVEEEVEEEAR